MGICRSACWLTCWRSQGPVLPGARPPPAGESGAAGPGLGARAGCAEHIIVVIIITTTESESLLAARFFRGVKKRSKSSGILGREETPAASW